MLLSKRNYTSEPLARVFIVLFEFIHFLRGFVWSCFSIIQPQHQLFLALHDFQSNKILKTFDVIIVWISPTPRRDPNHITRSFNKFALSSVDFIPIIQVIPSFDIPSLTSFVGMIYFLYASLHELFKLSPVCFDIFPIYSAVPVRMIRVWLTLSVFFHPSSMPRVTELQLEKFTPIGDRVSRIYIYQNSTVAKEWILFSK